MKHLTNFCTLLAVVFIFAGCSKNNSAPAPTTSLSITTTDALGNKIFRATVTLYSSQVDLVNGTNPVVSGLTDANGTIKFDKLSAIKYYWLATSDCQNNVNGSYVTTNPISANAITEVTTVLSGTGTLKFVNNSSNPYSIYVNGKLIGTVNGNTTSQGSYFPTGSYSIRVVQNSGYLLIPTDKTFTGNLECGDTLVTTFP